MGMHVADKTKRLRIGMAVSLAAFYHPLRLAEEVALLDVLSGGRVNWGAGRGFDPTEFATFGVPAQQSTERFREAVEIVLAAWNNERLSWQSEHWQFDNVEVLPKPAQAPHPPVWVAGSSPDSVGWAGRLGHSVMFSPHLPFATLAEHRRIFRDNLIAQGHLADDGEGGIGGREIPMARLIAVADTEAEAEQIARRGAAWILSTYKTQSKGTTFQASLARSGSAAVAEEIDPVQQYLDDVAVWGTPERVVDLLQQLGEEIDLDYLMCAPLSHSSFVSFTEKVLPKFV
jgi:alkanesulfonate monooxygenase SsuD/methylene tetrahydromethanopterin reductase-like flavin-dependent oxidoreductase (luciferase family)